MHLWSAALSRIDSRWKEAHLACKLSEFRCFWTLPWKRKQLWIPLRGTKIEANSRKSILWNKNRSKLSECRSEPFHGRENNSERNAAAEKFIAPLFWLLCKTYNFHGIPFLSELRYCLFRGTRKSECLGMGLFFRGITETVPSLFRWIFSVRNSVPNPTNPIWSSKIYEFSRKFAEKSSK